MQWVSGTTLFGASLFQASVSSGAIFEKSRFPSPISGRLMKLSDSSLFQRVRP